MNWRTDERRSDHTPSRKWLLGPVACAWLLCSCGSSPGQPLEAEATVADRAITSMLPGTSLFVMPSRNDALVKSAVPTRVIEPCPESNPAGGSARDAISESGRLEPMLGQVLVYGGQHSDTFGSYGLIWHGPGDASVFISFTSNLDVHRDALDKVLSLPDELIVCQVAISGDVAQALMVKLSEELAGRFAFVSQGAGAVEVVLLPGEDALANELIAQYGEAVAVSVCADDASCTDYMVREY